VTLQAPRILIASAYGRGHWLAATLNRLGFNVQLVDVTERLGFAPPEDQAGPFGYFGAPQWASGEGDALATLGTVTEAPQGFCLWLKSGPWELCSTLTAYRAEALSQHQEALNFVRHGHVLTVDRKSWIEQLKMLPFERRWIASVASDMMANRSQSANKAFEMSPPAPLFERYRHLCPESYDLAQSVKWCAEQGIVVTDGADIPDVGIEHSRVTGIEIKAAKSGFVRCHHLIWMLSSKETAYLSSRTFEKLFKGKSLEPEWSWVRYRLELEESRELAQLPLGFLSIEDGHLPWAHENFVLFQKGRDRGVFHAWLRLPHSQRFQREYLSGRLEPVLAHLRDRCSTLKIKNIEWLLEAEGNTQVLGPSLYPVYRPQDLVSPPGLNYRNLWFNQPERWPSYSASAILSSQMTLARELQRWWGRLTEEQKQKELNL
jgi:hypothetical protein